MVMFAMTAAAALAIEVEACGATAVKVSDEWLLSCSGGCPEAHGPSGPVPNPCIVDDETDAIGTYKACFCQAGGGESACCHTILRNGQPDSRGTCSDAPGLSCGGGDCHDGNCRENIVDCICGG